MAAPTIYKSSDASAPVLTGQVGTLIGVLDACLVNGYGAKSAAGWSKAFTGTNLASYLPSAGHYLDVNDAAAGTAGAQEATVRGYETMTAVATGTNPFPTTAQAASPGLFIRKSVTADSTARGWVVIADSTTFYLFILSGDTVGRYQSFGFGRFYSVKTSDTYRSIILGHTATGASSNAGLDLTTFTANFTTGSNGIYMPRIAAGTGTSIQVGVIAPAPGTAPGNGPNGIDGNIYIARGLLNEALAASGVRGWLRGIYWSLNGTGLNDGDTFSGTGDFAGRSFMILKTVNVNSTGYLALETTAWDTST